jgi:murein DD-endopeptidase MepM/ murein hydrolase activator NlpD
MEPVIGFRRTDGTNDFGRYFYNDSGCIRGARPIDIDQVSDTLIDGGSATPLRDRWINAGVRLKAHIDLWFPHRQLLIRGPGNVTSFALSQRQQLIAVGLAAGVLVWAVIASLGVALAIGDEVANAVARHALTASLARRDAEVTRLQIAAARISQLRDRDVATANLMRDQAIATANATIAAYQQKLRKLTDQTQGTIGQVETIIQSTGLNPQSMAAGRGRPNSGDAAAPEAGPGAAFLLKEIERLESLTNLLTRLPLAAPVANISVSSPFGFRPDPWTGVREFHVGVDLRGPVGTQVHATAPGVVQFAGTQTGYGNIVIIDHGFGLSTRYSHLSKILVSVGADVDLHQVIGLLGNTGWSTGPHLLYETRLDGQPHDPLKFIKVNHDGFQK